VNPEPTATNEKSFRIILALSSLSRHRLRLNLRNTALPRIGKSCKTTSVNPLDNAKEIGIRLFVLHFPEGFA
jgi:hypothetical protein